MSTALTKIQEIIGYRFLDIQLLRRALTHRSAEINNNERLEFLGDSVLGLVIAVGLYRRFPECAEGALTRCRAKLVREETLASIAREIQLGSLIVLGEGAVRSGAADRSSILADVLEALIGAIYVEAGLEQVELVIKKLFHEYWQTLNPATLDKDPKTELQERLQKIKRSLPKYTVVELIGEPHEREFVVECEIDEPRSHFLGRGRSRQKAEQKAAQRALEQVEFSPT